MRRLLPSPGDDVDLFEAYTPSGNFKGGGLPWVRVNMVSSLDGAISVRGRSRPLGGPPDRRLFMVLRSLADVIVVGAGTIRAEVLRAGSPRRRASGWPPGPGTTTGAADRGDYPVVPLRLAIAVLHLGDRAPDRVHRRRRG